MRVILSSGAEITGVELSADDLRTQLDELRETAGWLAMVRTAKEHGLTVRETVHLRADQVIGLIDEAFPEPDAGATGTPPPDRVEAKS